MDHDRAGHCIVVALDHGDWFGGNGSGFERINIACPGAILEKAVEAMTRAYTKYLQSCETNQSRAIPSPH